jgi:hypothetical protein
VTTIYRLAARKRRSLVLIERDAVILIQRGGLHPARRTGTPTRCR